MHELFSIEDLMKFQARLKEQLVSAAKTPFTMSLTTLEILALCLVGYVEFELFYRVFLYLSDGENQYWSPITMGLTAAIMVMAFHIMANNNPNNFAARFVNRAVAFLVPLFLIGTGLLIASILDVASMITEEPPVIIGDIQQIANENWLEILFSKISNPLAAISFSIGLGALAIINIFVSHNLLTKIRNNIEDIAGRITRAKQAMSDYRAILLAQKEYAALGDELIELDIWDDIYIRLQVASCAMSTIADALLPHKQWLNHQELAPASNWIEKPPAEPKQIGAAIKSIEKVTHDEIMKNIDLKPLEK